MVEVEKREELKSAEELLEFSLVKEAISSHAKTTLGREKVLNTSPYTNLEALKKKQKALWEMILLKKGGHEFSFLGLKDIRKTLEKVHEQGVVFEPGELLDIADLLSTARSVRRTLLRLDTQFEELREWGFSLPDALDLEESILSSISSREEVLDSASPKLARIRRKKKDVEERIRAIFRRLLRNPRIQKAVQTDRPVLRGDRLCLAVKIGYAHTIRGMVLDSSSTGQTVFIEPEQVVRWGNRLAEYTLSERREENFILRRLTLAVLKEEERLRRTLDILATLDALQAEATWALLWDMTVPEITENLLELHSARHPLLLELHHKQGFSKEEVLQKVIPFDIHLSHSVTALVVSGPNAGGKTVLLKSIGLLSLMAKSGLPIPVKEGAKVPFYDRIFISIGDDQNLLNALSTFSASVLRIREILEDSTSASLILLDEIGTGTDPEEAGALACAVFEKLLEKGAHTVVTTHLTRLKRFAFGRANVISASMEFDTEKLVPTYRMHLGIPGDSHALAIARKVGLSEEIVKKAEEMLHKTEEKEWIQRLEKEVNRVRKLREEAEIWEKEAKLKYEKLVREEQDLKKRKALLEREVELELERFRQSLLLKLPKILKEAYPTGSRQAAEKVKESLLQIIGSTSLGEKRQQFFHTLKKGKSVFLLSLARQGIVTKINKSKKTLRVRVGEMEVETNWEDVSPPVTGVYSIAIEGE